jgi:hypothetical protein
MWEQTAIISLYSINWLVFITETECVYCAVRTEYVYFRLNFIFRDRAVAQVVTSLLVNSRAQGRFQVSSCETYDKKVTLGQIVFEYSRYPLWVSCHPCSILIFICMLPLSEAQTDEYWQPYIKERSFGFRVAAGGEVLLLFDRLHRVDFQVAGQTERQRNLTRRLYVLLSRLRAVRVVR